MKFSWWVFPYIFTFSWQYSFVHSFTKHVVRTGSGLEPHGDVPDSTAHGLSQGWRQKAFPRRVSTSHACGGRTPGMPGAPVQFGHSRWDGNGPPQFFPRNSELRPRGNRLVSFHLKQGDCQSYFLSSGSCWKNEERSRRTGELEIKMDRGGLLGVPHNQADVSGLIWLPIVFLLMISWSPPYPVFLPQAPSFD